jgi:hypothetical protein
MEMRNNQLPPSPPGVIPALISGFNAVASRAVVIIIPIFFDLFLWLGPRLSLYNLITPVLKEMESMPDQPQTIVENMTLFTELFEKFNLFSVLRTFPLGIFSLMSGGLGTQSPLGERFILDLPSFVSFLLWMLLLTVVGWFLGCLYFYSVARISATGTEKLPTIGSSVLQGLLLSGFWSLIWVFVSIPLVIFMGVLLLISQTVASLVYLLIALLVIWLSMPIFFSAHGIFVNSEHLFRSVAKSFRMMRYALPSLGWFVIVAMVLSQGLNFLWRIPPSDSWMTLFGIFGHAFVSTALLAASFIYYRDLNIWVDAALQWMKTRTNSAQA